MDRVVVEPGLDGLGAMLGDLVRGNLERDPARASLLDGVSGTINVRARDADVAVGLEFAGGTLHVFGRPFKRAGLDIASDSGTLMEMSSVPLRFGLPDLATQRGRDVLKKMMRGDLRVRGIAAHPVLMTRLQRLLAVS